MEPAVRTLSLRDHLSVVRAHWLPILVLAIVVGGTAYALARTKTPTYEATATLTFRDEAPLVALVGQAADPIRKANVEAAVGNTDIVSPQVLARAGRALHATVPPGSVSSAPETSPGLVDVTARASSGAVAAAVANTVAQEIVAVQTTQQRRLFRRVMRELERRAGSAAQRRVLLASSLKAVIRPVVVSATAPVPGAPLSPKPVRSALFGALLGVLVGVAGTFFHDAWRRRSYADGRSKHAMNSVPRGP